MDILNKLDQQLNQLGKTVAEKAKNMTDSVASSGIIRQEEAKIEQCYAVIGKQIMQNSYPANLPKACEGLYEMIRSLEDEIHQKNLQSHPGQVPQASVVPGAASACAHCGALLEPDQLFCINCGARVQLETPVNTPNKVDAPAGSTYEKQELDKTELVAMQSGGKITGAQPEQAQISSAACPMCGAETTSGQVYCIQCGALL